MLVSWKHVCKTKYKKIWNLKSKSKWASSFREQSLLLDITCLAFSVQEWEHVYPNSTHYTCIIYIITRSSHIFIHRPSLTFSLLSTTYLTLQMLHYYPCLSDFSFSVSLFLPQRVKEEGRREDPPPPPPPDVSAIINSVTVAPLCFGFATQSETKGAADHCLLLRTRLLWRGPSTSVNFKSITDTLFIY